MLLLRTNGVDLQLPVPCGTGVIVFLYFGGSSLRFATGKYVGYAIFLRFGCVMRRAVAAAVVITNTQRKQQTLTQLHKLFTSYMGQRVVDVKPALPVTTGAEFAGVRYPQILDTFNSIRRLSGCPLTRSGPGFNTAA
ncbi:hypothetical protein [Paraburkholderia strydomiana]|uniref:hypothetical protein n=1 Tax=Paraburkholderia strydomiana TaxID=1245417 RepID=UPI0038B8E8EC